MHSRSLVLTVFILLALVSAQTGCFQLEATPEELEHKAIIRLPLARPAPEKGRLAVERTLPSKCTSTISRLWGPQAISDEIHTTPSLLTASQPSFVLCYSLTTPPPSFTLSLSLLYNAIDQPVRPVAVISLQVNSEVIVSESVSLSQDVLLLGPGALLPSPTDFLNMDATGLTTSELIYSVEVQGLWQNQTISSTIRTRWDNARWSSVEGENITYPGSSSSSSSSSDLRLPWMGSAFYAALPLRASDVRDLLWHLQSDVDLPFPVQATACLVTELDGCVNDASSCQAGGLAPILYSDGRSEFQGRYRIGYSSVVRQNASKNSNGKSSNCAATHIMLYVIPRAATPDFYGFAPVSFVSYYDVQFDDDDSSSNDVVTAVVVSVCVVIAIVVLGLVIHYFMPKPENPVLPTTSTGQENFPTSADEEGDRCALVRR